MGNSGTLHKTCVVQDSSAPFFHKRACPVCGNTDESKIVVESNFDPGRLTGNSFSSRKMPDRMRLRMVRCPQCDLAYASPALTEGFVREKYREAAFESGAEAQYAAATYARGLEEVLAHLTHRGVAVDVGAGDGAFLPYLMRAGFSKVVGVEPSAAPIRSAPPELAPLLQHAFFSAELFSKESLSCVTCFQTLEHVHSPMDVFLEIHKTLKPGGGLYVVTHNLDGLQSRVLKEKSPIFDIEHYQLFSPASLRALFEKSGFQQIHIRPISNSYPLSYWTQLLPLPEKLKSRTLSLLTRTRMGKLPLSFRAGNMMGFGFKPQNRQRAET